MIFPFILTTTVSSRVGNNLISALVMLCVVLVGCSGSSKEGQPTEASLRLRAERFGDLVGNGKWLDVYRYHSPRFREVSASGQFAVGMGMSMVVVRGFLGIEENEPLTFKVTDVTATGDKGIVKGDLIYKGEPVEFGEDTEGDSWVFVVGQWWYEEANWQEGCPLSFQQ